MEVVFGIIFLALVLFLAVMRMGLLFPRFGRWPESKKGGSNDGPR